MDNGGGGTMRAAGLGAVHRTPEDVFKDFRARQQGLLKAFTKDVERFYLMCDPEKENLCLYGLPNGSWEVNLPAEEVPPELPEPALGINFARDGMDDKDWLSLVAAHTDSWLLSVAFYFGARFGFDQDSRKQLFTSMINSVPTIFEVVTGTDKRQPKEKTPKNISKSNKSASKATRQLEPNPRSSKIAFPDNEESDREGEKEQEDHERCGACGENYGQEEFWICCDLCEKWFHGKCVKITPAKAEHIKQYKCPYCSSSSKRGRA